MKKLGIICIAVILTLGSIGIGYAQWSEALTVSGNAQAGTFDVVFNTITPPTNANGMTFSATPDVSDPTHKCNITLANVYPGSTDADFTFVLRNSGTIPAKITAVKIDGVNYTSVVSKDFNSPLDGNDIKISVTDVTTVTTIPVGETRTGHVIVHTCALSPDGNDATPGATGSFTLEIDTQQQ